MPAARVTATATRSGACRSAARRPSLINTAAPPTARKTGSDATALVTPSASGSSPVSAAATSVPGASAPHGTVHSPSRATTAADTRAQPEREQDRSGDHRAHPEPGDRLGERGKSEHDQEHDRGTGRAAGRDVGRDRFREAAPAAHLGERQPAEQHEPDLQHQHGAVRAAAAPRSATGASASQEVTARTARPAAAACQAGRRRSSAPSTTRTGAAASATLTRPRRQRGPADTAQCPRRRVRAPTSCAGVCPPAVALSNVHASRAGPCSAGRPGPMSPVGSSPTTRETWDLLCRY